ncbi:hypothetical protein KEM55_003189 [Ascosphaera atra]|nr:hypothetical protein KEM55_003189 [Ascosphaera atra]
MTQEQPMVELPPYHMTDEEAPSPSLRSRRSKDTEELDLGRKYIGHLERGLNSRHIQFFALSGAIGTGLFVGSGQVLSVAGPLSAFLVYIITGANIFAIISSLGEMATWLPVSGGLPVYGKRFVDQSLGFAMGWNYYYTIAIGVPMEVSAGALIIGFWPNDVPVGVWITLLFVPMVIINCLPVKFYGETEFLFGALKMITILGLIILMMVVDLGGAPSHDRIGFRYWANPGPMNTYLKPGALGRFLAFWKVFVQATFSYGGSETVIAAAGETMNPRRNIPRAVRRVFWRITIFYVLSIFFVGLCVSSKDPRLLDAIKNDSPGVAQSPFVIAIKNGQIRGLPHLINALLLCSAWSSGNASFYVSCRLLYATALEGNGPNILTWTKFGVPYACVVLTTAIGLLVYLNLGATSGSVFFWLSNLGAVSGLVIWAAVDVTYLRFFKALELNGIPRSVLRFKSPFQPYLAYFSLVFCTVVVVFNGFDCFFPGKFTAKAFIPAYIGVPIFFGLYFGHKLLFKTKVIPLEKLDLWSGKDAIDRLEESWEENPPSSFLGKVWYWIA